jgi:hypothetical protein
MWVKKYSVLFRLRNCLVTSKEKEVANKLFIRTLMNHLAAASEQNLPNPETLE